MGEFKIVSSEKNTGRDLYMNFFSQGIYLHFFRGQFADRAARGQNFHHILI